MVAVPTDNSMEPFGSGHLDERLCDFLVEHGRLKETDLVRARRLHEENAEGNLIPLLTRLGLVSERDMGWMQV